MKKYVMPGMLIIFTLIASEVFARIKLITLPVREKVLIQLDHQNVTIVEEERIVPLIKGTNTLDFSWHHSDINADSIVLRIPSRPEGMQVNVISVSYPPNEKALTWNVAASQNGSVKVRISYAINQLTKQYHYIAYSNHDETKMSILQFIKVNNVSGEEFMNAELHTPNQKPVALPLGIAESQEFKVFQADNLPILKTYTVNAAKSGYRDTAKNQLKVLMHYRLENRKENGLGRQPLPAGKLRIYQKDSSSHLVFIGEDWLPRINTGEETSIYMGEARDIVVKRLISQKKRHRINGNLFDLETLVTYQIQNFKPQAVNLIIQEDMAFLRHELYSGYGMQWRNDLLSWQIGEKTDFSETPIKSITDASQLGYQITLPPKKENQAVVEIKKQLNIIFKNEW